MDISRGRQHLAKLFCIIDKQKEKLKAVESELRLAWTYTEGRQQLAKLSRIIDKQMEELKAVESELR